MIITALWPKNNTNRYCIVAYSCMPVNFCMYLKHTVKKKKKDSCHVWLNIIACMSAAESHTYQLRAYLYQARDMYGSDRSGLSDPYAIISLSRYSSRSRVVKADVCPTWDQTIIISNIRIFGATQSIEECPPPVVLEFFDEDQLVRLIN